MRQYGTILLSATAVLKDHTKRDSSVYLVQVLLVVIVYGVFIIKGWYLNRSGWGLLMNLQRARGRRLEIMVLGIPIKHRRKNSLEVLVFMGLLGFIECNLLWVVFVELSVSVWASQNLGVCRCLDNLLFGSWFVYMDLGLRAVNTWVHPLMFLELFHFGRGRKANIVIVIWLSHQYGTLLRFPHDPLNWLLFPHGNRVVPRVLRLEGLRLGLFGNSRYAWLFGSGGITFINRWLLGFGSTHKHRGMILRRLNGKLFCYLFFEIDRKVMPLEEGVLELLENTLRNLSLLVDLIHLLPDLFNRKV